MTAGKSKKVPKGSKKQKKKDAFKKKAWYKVSAPAQFKVRNIGLTPVNKTSGTVIETDSLKGRVFDVSCGDLMQDEQAGHNYVRLKLDQVNGDVAETSFAGFRFSTDKMKGLVRKWHTMIRASCDVKTSDNHVIRMFAIGFTKRRHLQAKKTSYAQSSQVKTIQRKMKEVMTKAASKTDTKKLTQILVANLMGKEIEKQCASVYPLNNTFVYKIKVLGRK